MNAVLGCVLAQKLIAQLREMLGGLKRGDTEVPNAPFYSENLGAFRTLLKKIKKLFFVLYVPILPLNNFVICYRHT